MIDINTQKEIAYNILIYFDKVCRKHKLRYYLAYGTLLGAVRHKGFIPWDDDIDVMMPREDYNRLLTIFPEHPYYKIMDISINSNYGRLFGVLNDIRTIKEEKLLRKRSNDKMSINIDIFPLDFLPEDYKMQAELLKKVRTIEKSLACLTYRYGRGRTFMSTVKKNIGIAFFRTLEALHLISIKKLKKKHDLLLSKFNSNSKVIGSLTNTQFNGIKEFMPRSYFEEAIELEFEGLKFYVPKEYDAILTHIYGNYMTLPPIEKRFSHHTSICKYRQL